MWMQLLAKSLTGKEIAREVIQAHSTHYSAGSTSLLAPMRDGASTNGVAMRTIAVVYPHVIAVTCFSHALDRVSDHFQLLHYTF